MDLCPLQEQVRAYGRTYEAKIKDIAMSMVESYLDTLPFEELEKKFILGCKTHGPMPKSHDWGKEAVDEVKDLFWYVAMMQHQASVHPVLNGDSA